MVGTRVIYLSWPPLGVQPLERFVASYRRHPAALDHSLVIVQKGQAPPALRARLAQLAGELGAEHLTVPAVGIDLDTYRRVGAELPADRLCLLNSSSTVLADGWLAVMAQALDRPGVGLIGATGSHESALSAAPRPLRPLLRRRYPAFPNPHIRTNAFMLRRELMLDLEWPERLGSKRRALALESGTRSITRQVAQRGLQVLVAGRDRRTFGPEHWAQSLTFRSAGQENLLVADNRTREYDDAPAPRRAELAGYAWGRDGDVSLRPLGSVPTE